TTGPAEKPDPLLLPAYPARGGQAARGVRPAGGPAPLLVSAKSVQAAPGVRQLFSGDSRSGPAGPARAAEHPTGRQPATSGGALSPHDAARTGPGHDPAAANARRLFAAARGRRRDARPPPLHRRQ